MDGREFEELLRRGLGHAAALTRARKERLMQFILGVIFFVIVVGLVDAGLPWPAPKGRSR
jgi:hypothetical protein